MATRDAKSLTMLLSQAESYWSHTVYVFVDIQQQTCFLTRKQRNGKKKNGTNVSKCYDVIHNL